MDQIMGIMQMAGIDPSADMSQGPGGDADVQAAAQIVEPWSTITTLSDDEKKDIVDRVVEKFRYAESNMADVVSKWMAVQDAYRSEREFTVGRGQKKPESRIKTGLMRRLINRMVAMLCVRIVQPYSNFISARIRKSKVRAYKIENFLFDLYKKHKIPMEIVKVVTRTALYGVGFTKTVPNPESLAPDCTVYTVNQFDIKIDPYATSMDDCDFVVERLWVDHDTVLARIESGAWDEKFGMEMIKARAVREVTDKDGNPRTGTLMAKNLVRMTTKDYDSGEILRDGGIKARTLESGNIDRSDARGVSDSSVSKFDRYMVYEYHDRGNIYWVGEEKYFLRAVDNPIGFPYQDWRLLPSTGEEFWVKSHGEYFLELQHEMDVKRNQRIENINKLLNPTMLIGKGFISDPSKLILDSGVKVLVNNMDDYKFVEYDNVTDTTLAELQYMQSEGEDEANIGQVAQGKAAKGERMTTAESNNVYSLANLPFDFGSSLLVITGMAPMFNTILQLCGVTWRGEFPMASTNPNQTEGVDIIQPAEFVEDYDITISINPNKEEIDKQDAIETYQLFSQNPFIDQVVLLQWILPRMHPDYPPNLISAMMLGGQPIGIPTGQPQPGNVQLSNTGGGNPAASGGPQAKTASSKKKGSGSKNKSSKKGK